jgi:hypothetical protein
VLGQKSSARGNDNDPLRKYPRIAKPRQLYQLPGEKAVKLASANQHLITVPT